MLEALTEKVRSGTELSPQEATAAARALATAEVSEAAKGEFLSAFAAKGETVAELSAFAAAYRAMANDPGVGEWSDGAIDVVGTGGDHAGGFNISSLVVLVLASCGVVVMKHGNRGITSKCGSADLLAALGVNLEAPPEKLRGALRALGYCFFFAPAYHPAFKHIAPVRKSLAARGQRTVFNVLGPLINPGRPSHTLLGVSSAALVPRLAETLEALGTRSGLAAHGVIDASRGIDELTTATVNRVRGIGALRAIDGTWRPEDQGFVRGRFSDLVGGDLPANLALVDAILAGQGPAALVDTIVLNSAIGLWICGHAPDIPTAVPLAREALLGGAVKRKIAATREFYQS